jgi:hypothetical protein
VVVSAAVALTVLVTCAVRTVVFVTFLTRP